MRRKSGAADNARPYSAPAAGLASRDAARSFAAAAEGRTPGAYSDPET